MEVEIIKAKNRNEDSYAIQKFDRLRVAAYCRVSTDDEDQIKSYNSMVKHYTDLIQSSADWEYVGVYADRGITGTKVDKREEFQKLINDCLNGKIDMVIAKSIPRFARNTLDTLKYVRLLREKNVAVYFEVEKINTIKDGEFLMTILSSVAQQEVENTSAYVKKGLKMKMKRGELIGFQGCIGYDYDLNTKTLSVNPEGAKVVEYIFERYINGAGSTVIARELNEKGILTYRGNEWVSSTILGVLENEKYIGDIRMGKTFTLDPISKRRLDNHGEEEQYYIHDHHEPIISKEVFEKAQEIRNRRNGKKKSALVGKREKYSRQYAFSCLLECGFCGSNLSRRNWHSGTANCKTIWQCVTSTKKGKKNCPDSKGIPEYVIEKAFMESYRMLYCENKEILDQFLKRLEKSLSEENSEKNLHVIQTKIRNLTNKRNTLLDKYLEDTIDKELYQKTDGRYTQQILGLEEELELIQNHLSEQDDLKKRIQEFKKVLTQNEGMTGFDRHIFESIIEKVIVGGYDDDGKRDPYKLTFIYKTGFKNTVDDANDKFGLPKKKPGRKPKNMCSDIIDNVKNVCSNVINNTL
ncbi:MAG: recombinase family protein [Eubacteriales bacterium]|nr:recombinase family protein [Eubacteriales bacterium]